LQIEFACVEKEAHAFSAAREQETRLVKQKIGSICAEVKRMMFPDDKPPKSGAYVYELSLIVRLYR
jgi:hypothetical protein